MKLREVLALSLISASVVGNTQAIEGAQGAEQKEFRIICDDDSYVFSNVCAGRFEGILGLRIWQLDNLWREDNDPTLDAHGLRAIEFYSPGSKPRQIENWTGFSCRVLDYELVAYDSIVEFRGDQCQGYRFANENFRVTDVHVAVVPNGVWIAKVSGVYKGNPDNSVVAGSFRDALESRFQGRSCHSSQSVFCRERGIQQDYVANSSRNTDTARISVTQSTRDPSEFYVEIENVDAVEWARALFNLRIMEQQKKAPVSDF